MSTRPKTEADFTRTPELHLLQYTFMAAWRIREYTEYVLTHDGIQRVQTYIVSNLRTDDIQSVLTSAAEVARIRLLQWMMDV